MFHKYSLKLHLESCLNGLLYEPVPVGAAALWEIPASRELQEVTGVSEALSAVAAGRVSRVRAGYTCAHSTYGRTANVKPIARLQTSKPLQNVGQSSHRCLKVRKKCLCLAGLVWRHEMKIHHIYFLNAYYRSYCEQFIIINDYHYQSLTVFIHLFIFYLIIFNQILITGSSSEMSDFSLVKTEKLNWAGWRHH